MVGQLIERGFQVKGKSGPEAEAMRRDIDETMKEWLHQNLDEAQDRRLFQIGIQWEGASAFRHPSVADHLELLPAQRERIDRILKERNQRQIAGRLGPSEFDRFSGEAIAVLHPLQKQRWNRLLGPPCHFTIRRPALTSSHPGPEVRPTGG